jgi:undecaprenyl-diphosphatase
MNTLEAFNQALFLLINGTTATPAWLVGIAMLIADYVIWLIPLLLAAMWLWGSEAQRNLAIRACLVAMFGVGANQLIGQVWQHPRPFMIGLGHTFLPHAPDSSFPSDHATVFAGIALTLLLGGARGLAGSRCWRASRSPGHGSFSVFTSRWTCSAPPRWPVWLTR